MERRDGRLAGLRVGADVGGTFTDLVAIGVDGTVHTWKVSSTPDDFGRAIVEGLAALLDEAGLAPSAVAELVHGTTVATNAILEHKGARTGLLTTRGFRDVLELRRLRMPRLYDLFWEKPPPLVPRHLRLEVDERVDGRGQVARPLDPAQALAAAERLVGEGVESLAIALLHSYANPVHERQLGELVRARWPHLAVSLSCEVLPAIREYERTSTTVVNAYVQPVVEGYLRALARQLRAAGVSAPVLIMQSNGGIMTAAAAAARPAYIIESGPAAGVIASVELARRLGLGEVITFDMGGTTAKASLIEGGAPSFTSEFEVGAGLSLANRLLSGSGYALALPVIDLSEVGAGGGSIVWLDAGGAPRVGPQSAGARPGPVCYRLGGEQPTITDVNLVLGYLPPALLDGAMPLDHDAARRALQRQIAAPLGLDLLAAAYGVHQLANAAMIRAVKAVSTYRGRDPRDHVLFAFGGSGPVHAAAMARELQVRRVLVPPAPGLFSALGLLDAAIEHHAVRTFLRRIDRLSPAELEQAFNVLAGEAVAEVAAQGYRADSVALQPAADLRYAGQSFELTVPLPARRLDQGAVEELVEAFGREHLRTYGHRLPQPVELVNLRVSARVQGQRAEARPSLAPRPPAPRPQSSARPAYFGPRLGRMETPVLRREDLSRRPERGPLIVEEYDATVVVPPDCAAWRDDLGNIVVEVGA